MNKKNSLIKDDWYNKYIKYKNKYINLKNQEGGYLNELQKKRLNDLKIDVNPLRDLKMLDSEKEVINDLKIDNNLIRDLEMLDSKEEVINEIINLYEQQRQQELLQRQRWLQQQRIPIKDNNLKILFEIEEKKYKLEEFGLIIQHNLLSRGYFNEYIQNIMNTPMLFGQILVNSSISIYIYRDKIFYYNRITGENIVLPEDLKKECIIMHYILFISPKKTPSELVCDIFEPDIKRLSLTKPVATLPSGDAVSIFQGYWDYYTEAQKKEVENLLSDKLKNEIKIFKPERGRGQFVFYIPEKFEELCKKFKLDVLQGLNIIGIFENKPVMEMYFIKCAFDNSYDDIDEFITKNNLDPTLCNKL